MQNSIVRGAVAAAAVLLAVTAIPFSARAATITLGATHDTTIFQNNPNNGSGAGNGLFAGTNSTSSPRRALISFDVSAIPANAVAQSVELTLYLGQVAGSGGGVPGGGTDESTIELHRITAPWGEGTSQQHSPPSDTLAAQGQGAEATVGDATWNERFFGSASPLPWLTPGGDFVAAPSSSVTVGRSIDVPYSWPSTPALIGDVQRWFDDPATNYGWMLVNNDEIAATTFRAFYSRDVATADFFPMLTINFATPALAAADFDADHDVDGRDFLIWQRNAGAANGADRATGDANGDGAVSALDLQAWRQEFGVPTTNAFGAPEPRTIGLAAGILTVVIPLRRRQPMRRA